MVWRRALASWPRDNSSRIWRRWIASWTRVSNIGSRKQVGVEGPSVIVAGLK